MPKNELLQIRISSELKEKLKENAQAENRTLSNYILTVLQEKIKQSN